MTGKTQRTVDASIDQLVQRVNRSRRPLLPPDDVPEFLREAAPPGAGAGLVAWAIRAAPSPCRWVDEFEARLPGRLPRSYRSLIARYLFPSFESGQVILFANTGAVVHDDLVRAVFRDSRIWTPLLTAGFAQFGRPADGSYDPVAFDLNRRTNMGESAVVRLDHEAALMHQRVEVVAELAPSFLALAGV